jgi:hypothetical protein
VAVPADPSLPVDSAESRHGSSSLVKTLHYVVIGLLVLGGLGYWMLKPRSLNPMADSRSAEVMALVQTHRAQAAPTLRHAIDDRVQRLQAQGRGVRAGEWRVEQETPDTYLVRIIIREEGSRSWFEREYLWRVNLPKRTVEGMTLSAVDLMP